MKTGERETKPGYGIVNFERRKPPKFYIDLPVEYSRINSSMNHTGPAVGGGLLIYFPEEMEIGQRLRMKLFFTSGFELKAIEMLTEVVWIDIHLGEGWGDYRTGVRFLDISPEDMTKLKNFLRSLSSP